MKHPVLPYQLTRLFHRRSRYDRETVIEFLQELLARGDIRELKRSKIQLRENLVHLNWGNKPNIKNRAVFNWRHNTQNQCNHSNQSQWDKENLINTEKRKVDTCTCS